MAAKVFIDGAYGTTGLEIHQRLEGRPEFSLQRILEADRKNARARSAALNDADLVILCLPDAAAREAAGMVENPAVRIIDASTAHRVAPEWVYGFPELEKDQAQRIADARRVSNPGCYPTGFLALVRPLVRDGILPPDFPLTVTGLSGYSGGGRSMIDEFENAEAKSHTRTVARNYALDLAHKHVPEMKKHAGLAHAPVFSPTVARYYRGMIVEVPLQLWALPGRPKPADLRDSLAEAYRGRPLVEVASGEESDSLKTLDVELMKNSNAMKLFVFSNEEEAQARLVAVLDNLGKGASGAAVQNLNLMLGLPQTAGL
ncbi:MAG: N-acetyl-gamma-glutamyl-phosphate reductase [Alphaproteobacteria bacterium]|nr:N-acetyl-gamma-glutamyl-phosphate reductase [Alphaproteobacteria bacterium]